LQAANKPNIDRLAKTSEIGLVKTVPDHLNPPGSDIANMSVLGYDPDVYYTGRSPLEAVSMGITMADEDLAIRCNVVHLSEEEEEYEKKTMVDYSSDEITTEESRILMEYIEEKLGSPDMKFYPGVSYRHCIIAKMPGEVKLGCTPPHDITGKCIAEYMPSGDQGKFLIDYMKKSYELLLHHPVNEARREKGLNTANSIWPWGEGRRPGLSNFEKKYHLKGAVISAVDLVMGLGICADMEVIKVPNVTGNINTNFDGKAQAAIDFFKSGGEFVYLHMEAPDECGHRHEIENKKKSIEIIDSKVVGPIYDALKEMDEDFKILVMPDHPTPLAIRTHTHEPVPYMIFDSRKEELAKNENATYDESYAASTGIYNEIGFKLMDKFINE
ncbi:MAG: cofactor-independent phosphoglycerate mutase, partial [Clostridia bacterium]|nr:cofactor-independent phosphoglycerate mutase [Clostridia bacterium]